MLYINDLTYRIGGRTLFEKASLSISAGQRVGLVGPNGVGKTTLFKLIANELVADGGDITMIKNATMGMVRQDLPDDETKLIDIVLAADTERDALMREAETAHDAERIGYIYERLSAINAYDAPSRAATILAGLGFNDEAQNRPISDFSGGWRMRVALAATLFRKPNLLMLDEPTNHLDFEAMVWLENYLARYSETLLIISHDRDILNKTVTHILHMENQKLTSYTGTYDEFERRRAEKLLNQQALHEKQMKQKAHMQAFVDRFGAKASKAKQAQSRLKAIAKMDIVDAVMAERVTAFTFPKPDELKSPLITLDRVDVGYEEARPILKKLDLRIDMDDRIALLGANGNGKSTLVKLLSGRLKQMGGDIVKSGKLRVGYFAQFQKFSPYLPTTCPIPMTELETFYGPDYIRDTACVNYVENLSRCQVVLTPPVNASSACSNFLTHYLNYNGCVVAHQNDSDFLGTNWHIYLGRSGAMWRSSHEVVKLLDADGKTVDAFSY